MQLKVGKAGRDEIGHDIVRIHHKDRPEDFDRHDIVRIRVGKQHRLVTVRGGEEPGVINIDIDNREDLGIAVGNVYDFQIEHVCIWRRIWWQWWATDPAVRLPAKIAAWSFALGFFGLLLGVAGLVVGIVALYR